MATDECLHDAVMCNRFSNFVIGRSRLHSYSGILKRDLIVLLLHVPYQSSSSNVFGAGMSLNSTPAIACIGIIGQHVGEPGSLQLLGLT